LINRPPIGSGTQHGKRSASHSPPFTFYNRTQLPEKAGALGSRKPNPMLHPLPDHPDLGILPLTRMSFDIAGKLWDLDVVRDEKAQMAITPDRDLYPFGLMIWEAAVVLSRVMAERGPALADVPILELGCGIGLPGLVAQRHGARVVQTDHDALALALCRYNAVLNKVGGVQQFVGDWHKWTHPARYPLIIGADIIYDTADYALLEKVFRANLVPGGEVLLTDPKRQQTIALFTIMEDAGWTISITERAIPAILEVERAEGLVTVQIVSARLS
jgi:methyltransferase-like protein 23